MASASLQGQTLGKYRILEPLGRGGMARVYRGYHPQLDRYVAVKVLRPDLVDDAEFLARFQREARSVAGLRHPNIIQVYDFDVQDGIYYMVIELLEGDTLKAWLNNYRASDECMPLGDIVHILLNVLDGLAYAHGEGMIHRDIKPANIMLTSSGQAVLTDFGIAQIVGGTQHTVSGALMGTLNYMAPEQGLKGACDARSDIYSLGIVFYEMLTRSIPFDADTPLAILMKHLNDPLPLPRQVDPSIPESFERVVLKTLAKQAGDRYQTASEMAKALYAAAKHAQVDIPARVSSIPVLGADQLSDSVIILSGTARADIRDMHFADAETDTTLDDRLAQERAASITGARVDPVQADSKGAVSRDAVSQQSVSNQTDPEQVSLAQIVPARALSQFFSDLVQQRIFQLQIPAGVAIPVGVGFAVAFNLGAVWLSGLLGNWAIFEIGWPIELLVAACALAFMMYSTSTVWLLIPTWILMGNGLLFSYCSLTNNWQHWAFLWPAEPLLLATAVIVTIQLARRRDFARRLSRPLGCGLVATCSLWSLVVAIGAMVVGLFR